MGTGGVMVAVVFGMGDGGMRDCGLGIVEVSNFRG